MFASGVVTLCDTARFLSASLVPSPPLASISIVRFREKERQRRIRRADRSFERYEIIFHFECNEFSLAGPLSFARRFRLSSVRARVGLETGVFRPFDFIYHVVARSQSFIVHCRYLLDRMHLLTFARWAPVSRDGFDVDLFGQDKFVWRWSESRSVQNEPNRREGRERCVGPSALSLAALVLGPD